MLRNLLEIPHLMMPSTHESWPIEDIRHSFGEDMTAELKHHHSSDKTHFSAMDHFIGLLYKMVHAAGTRNDTNKTVAGHVC